MQGVKEGGAGPSRPLLVQFEVREGEEIGKYDGGVCASAIDRTESQRKKCDVNAIGEW